MNKQDEIRYHQEARYIVDTAPNYVQRTGQFLFNSLRHEVSQIVRSSHLDPFYKEMSYQEVVEWLENHIIYDETGRMIALFDEDRILWEEEK